MTNVETLEIKKLYLITSKLNDINVINKSKVLPDLVINEICDYIDFVDVNDELTISTLQHSYGATGLRNKICKNIELLLKLRLVCLQFNFIISKRKSVGHLFLSNIHYLLTSTSNIDKIHNSYDFTKDFHVVNSMIKMFNLDILNKRLIDKIVLLLSEFIPFCLLKKLCKTLNITEKQLLEMCHVRAITNYNYSIMEVLELIQFKSINELLKNTEFSFYDFILSNPPSIKSLDLVKNYVVKVLFRKYFEYGSKFIVKIIFECIINKRYITSRFLIDIIGTPFQTIQCQDCYKTKHINNYYGGVDDYTYYNRALDECIYKLRCKDRELYESYIVDGFKNCLCRNKKSFNSIIDISPERIIDVFAGKQIFVGYSEYCINYLIKLFKPDIFSSFFQNEIVIKNIGDFVNTKQYLPYIQSSSESNVDSHKTHLDLPDNLKKSTDIKNKKITDKYDCVSYFIAIYIVPILIDSCNYELCDYLVFGNDVLATNFRKYTKI